MRSGSSFPRFRHFVLGLVVAVLGIGGPWTACRADPEPTVDLTAEERAWLDERDVVRHVAIPDYAPVESYGSGGRPVGIAPDYLTLVAERLGVTVETVRAPDWQSALDSVRQGRADLITAIQKTPSRSEYLTFTGPYLSVPDVILVRSQVERQITMSDLGGHAVAVVEEYAANEYLRERYPDVRYRRVSEVETGLEKTSFGSVDAMVLGLPVASSAIERTQITNLRVAGKTGYVYHLRFGVRDEAPMLRRVLDKALSSVTASTHKTIYDRWISLDEASGAVGGWNVWYILLTVLGGLLVVLGAGTAWNWSLQREVARRTEELRAAKAEAEEMNRLKSAFLANMNHEFRTPLTSIIGFADTLADNELKAPANRFSRHIRENGKRLLETLDSVLHLAQLEAGAMTLDPEPVSVVEEVERMVGLFREQAAQKEVRLLVESTDTALDAALDPAAFERILSNLLSNAIKFSEAGDTVTVRVGREGDAFVVEVEDTGVGIDPDFAPKLYDAFEQESAGTDREYEGVGLGLAITRKLTELMGGTIAVESEKESGTRFTVRLPQRRPGVPARMASGETDAEWQTNGT
jgi:signal transduction histidine kinase